MTAKPSKQPQSAPIEQAPAPSPSGESATVKRVHELEEKARQALPTSSDEEESILRAKPPKPIRLNRPDAGALRNGNIMLPDIPDYYPEALRDSTERLMSLNLLRTPTMHELEDFCLNLVGDLTQQVDIMIRAGVLDWSKARDAVWRFIPDLIRYNCVDARTERSYGCSAGLRAAVTREIVDIVRKSGVWDRFITVGQDAFFARAAPTTMATRTVLVFRFIDDRNIQWRGKTYTLTPNQRIIIKALYKAYEDGLPEVYYKALLKALKKNNGEIRYFFQSSNSELFQHPGSDPSGCLILKGAGKGTLRLNLPAKPTVR